MSGEKNTSALERLKQRRSDKAAAADDGSAVRTIFIVDDERPNLDALGRTLADRYEVTSFDSPFAALEEIKTSGCPDLIITDQRMPGMVGVELLDAVGDLHPQSVGIILSGFTERKDLVGAVNTGRVFSYVTKPWQPATLMDTISAALELADKRQEEAAITESLKDLGSQFDELADLLGEESGVMDNVAEKLEALTSSLEMLDG